MTPDKHLVVKELLTPATWYSDRRDAGYLLTLDHRRSIALVAVPSEGSNCQKTPQISRKVWLVSSVAILLEWNGVEHNILPLEWNRF